MKKFLLMFSTVLMLMVCLCTPSFAVLDCGHDSSCNWDSCGFHSCDFCGSDFDCTPGDGGLCSECGNPVSHDFSAYKDYTHRCVYCGLEGGCDFIDGVCVCGRSCNHVWVTYGDGSHLCLFCSLSESCILENGVCSVCSYNLSHSYCECDCTSASIVADILSVDVESASNDYSIFVKCLDCGGRAFGSRFSCPMLSSFSASYLSDFLINADSFTWDGVDCLCGEEYSGFIEFFDEFLSSSDYVFTFRFINDSIFVFLSSGDVVLKPLPLELFFWFFFYVG